MIHNATAISDCKCLIPCFIVKNAFMPYNPDKAV